VEERCAVKHRIYESHFYVTCLNIIIEFLFKMYMTTGIAGVSEKIIRTIIIFFCLNCTVTAVSGQNSNGNIGASGLKLREVHVKVEDVFDSTESFYKYRIARLVNTLHINTKLHVVNRELLFLRDSLLTYQRLSESTNNLRATGIFQRVNISIDTLDNRSANVAVSVKDHFTSQVRASFSVVGGTIHSGIGLSDKNFAGRGYNASFNVENQPDSRDFFLGKFVNPRVFGSRFVNSVQYLKYDDAEFQLYQLRRPFYSQETQWDMNAEYIKIGGDQFLYVRRNKHTKDDQQLRQARFGFGRYFGNTTRMRIGLAYFHQTEQLSGPDIKNGIQGWKSRRVILSLGGINRSISVWKNIDRSEYEEDVHTGFLINAGLGFDIEALGSDFARKSYSGSAIYSRLLTGKEYAHFSIFHNRLQQGGSTLERVTSVRFSFSSIRFHRQTIAAKLTFSQLDSRRPFSQLFLGEDTGLRGYSIRDFIGKRLILINIEDRIFTNLQLWFIRLGTTLFFDSGKVWGDGKDFNSADWHSSIGFGLRLGDPKSSLGILRLDLAFNLDSNRFSTLSLTKGSYFQALYPISF